MTRTAALLFAAGLAAAQSATPLRTARIEGVVLSQADRQPLRRAHVIPQPLEAGGTAIGVDADDKGAFLIDSIAPGEYSLSARRDAPLRKPAH